jgi:L-iditol 2-dehydrogenase
VSCTDYRQPGAFAQNVVIPARILYRLPDQVTFVQGAMVEPLTIALHAIDRLGGRVEEPVVVVGAGLIGLMVVGALRAKGVERIIAVDIDAGRLARAEALGAEPVGGTDPDVVVATILRLTSDLQPGVVFEAVGLGGTVDLAVRMARKGGSVVLVGNIAPRVDLALQAAVTRELTFLGSAASAGEYPEAIDLIARGRIGVDALVSAVVPLREGGPWMHRLQAGDPGLLKVVLEP